MTTYGVTDAGFVIKPLEVIIEERKAFLRSVFGASINLNPPSNFAQLAYGAAQTEFDVWQKLEVLYNSRNPDAATGASLAMLAAITGTVKRGAERSTGHVVAIGTIGTPVNEGRVFSVVGTSVRFRTTEDATLALFPTWLASTEYAFGALVTKGGNAYFNMQQGESGGTGPTGTGLEQVDNECIWRFVAAGTAGAWIPVESEEPGVKVANAGTLTVIETAVSGLDEVNNPVDMKLGRDEETDTELRLRREAELHASANASMSAIRTRVSQLTGVLSARVFENSLDVEDENGLPPHSFEVLVQGGDDQDIFNALWDVKPAGIQSFGLEIGSVVDSEGQTQTVKFSRPEVFTIWVIVNLQVNPLEWPINGDALTKQALLDYEAEYLVTGKDVVSRALGAAILQNVPGTIDAEVLIGTTNPPVATTTVPVNIRQIADLDSTRIDVAVTTGIP